MKKWFAVLFTLIFVVQIVAQNNVKNSDSDEYGEVRGFIYNGENGDRIQSGNVWVAEINRTATSDADGFFAVTNVPVVRYRVFCFANGYDTAIVVANVYPNAIARKDF